MHNYTCNCIFLHKTIDFLYNEVHNYRHSLLLTVVIHYLRIWRNYYGIWNFCLLPPIIAIALALKTKQTLPSLFIAVWVGATIIKGWNPIAGFTAIISEYMIPSIASEYNAGLLVLVTMAGGFAYMLKITGAAEAFAKLVTKSINTQKKGQVITALSAFIFCYTEPCLILGTIMRPITDRVRVSRAKLSYMLDSLGCNLASFSPISSYGPFISVRRWLLRIQRS